MRNRSAQRNLRTRFSPPSRSTSRSKVVQGAKSITRAKWVGPMFVAVLGQTGTEIMGRARFAVQIDTTPNGLKTRMNPGSPPVLGHLNRTTVSVIVNASSPAAAAPDHRRALGALKRWPQSSVPTPPKSRQENPQFQILWRRAGRRKGARLPVEFSVMLLRIENGFSVVFRQPQGTAVAREDFPDGTVRTAEESGRPTPDPHKQRRPTRETFSGPGSVSAFRPNSTATRRRSGSATS